MIKGQQLSIVPIDNKMRKKYIEYGHVHRRHFIDIEVESIRMEDVVLDQALAVGTCRI